MIELAESRVREFCKNCGDELINSKIYIADFFEYEMGTTAVIFEKDNSIYYLPLHFSEENGKMIVLTSKGLQFENINQMGEETKHLHNRFVSDAVVSFEYKSNK